MRLEKLASYRTSTAPVDVTVTGNVIAVSDLMKSVCLVEYKEGENGMPDTMTEVARHFQTVWATGVANIAPDTFLESDAEGNLIVLRRNTTGVEEDDKRRLEVTGEISLGEMVNRIRPVNIQQLASVAVTPRAFLGTVSFSLSSSTSCGRRLTESISTTGGRFYLPICYYQSGPPRLLDASASDNCRKSRIGWKYAIQ